MTAVSSVRTRTLFLLSCSILVTISLAFVLTRNVEGSYASHSLLLAESAAGKSCAGTAGTCSINLLGSSGADEPGDLNTRNVVLRNEGDVPAALTLHILGCTAYPDPEDGMNAGSDSAGFCSRLDITIGSDGTCLLPRMSHSCPPPSSRTTLASLGATTLRISSLRGGESTAVTITTLFDPSATNADQGFTADDPMQWVLTA